MTPKEQPESKLRDSHIPQPLIAEDQVLRLVIADLTHNRILKIRGQSPLLRYISLGLLCLSLIHI